MNIPSPAEFAAMNRAARLAALRRAQDFYGIDAPEYRRLAAVHIHLLRKQFEYER